MVDKMIFALFVFILVFSPTAFGSVEEWSQLVMEGGSLLLCLLILLQYRVEKRGFYRPPGLLLLLCFLMIPVLQFIPLPVDMVSFISPKAYEIYSGALGETGLPEFIPLSLSLKGTLHELLRFLSYGAFYFSTVQILASRENFRRVLVAIVVFASILALFSIVQHLLPNGRIYWLRPLTQGGTPFGPYVNRNHYAGLMEMIFPLVVALFFYYRPVVVYGRFRERLAGVLSQMRTNLHLLTGFSALLIALSVFLSLSRGGIVSISLSMMIFGLLIIVMEGKGRRGLLIMFLFMLILLAVGWFGWDPIFDRFSRIRGQEGEIAELRLRIWGDVLKGIGDFWTAGSGFGSFVHLYPLYQGFSGDRIATHAHNDFLELLLEGGIGGFLIFGVFIFIILRNSWGRYLHRRDPLARYLFIGALSGVSAILFHSVTDFNLHIGANGLYFAFLLGVVVSASATRFHGRREMMSLLPVRHVRKYSPAIISITLIITALLLVKTGTIIGEVKFRQFKRVFPSKDKTAVSSVALRRLAVSAVMADPLEPSYRYALGQTFIIDGDLEGAIPHITEAVRLNPLKGEYLQGLGTLFLSLGESGKGEALLRRGSVVQRQKLELLERYASWLLAQGRKEEGVRLIKEGMEREPKRAGELFSLMILGGLGDDDIRSAIPEKFFPIFRFGEYLEATGKFSKAEAAYLRALSLYPLQEAPRPYYYQRVVRFYLKRKEREKAIRLLNEAVKVIPGDPGLRISLGRLYEEEGILYRAIEEYRKGLLLAPDNLFLRNRLEELLGRGPL